MDVGRRGRECRGFKSNSLTRSSISMDLKTVQETVASWWLRLLGSRLVQEESSHYLYVVTNRHVVEEGCSVVRMTAQNGSTTIKTVPVDPKLGWQFPTGNDNLESGSSIIKPHKMTRHIHSFRRATWLRRPNSVTSGLGTTVSCWVASLITMGDSEMSRRQDLATFRCCLRSQSIITTEGWWTCS